MQNWDYDPKDKTYKISKEDIPIEHDIYVKPPIGEIVHKLKEDSYSWEDLQKFIYQANRRFLSLWLAIVACFAVSTIAILLTISR